MNRASLWVLPGVALAFAALVVVARVSERAASDPERLPSDWFGMQRAYPGETVNQDAYLRAVEWARVERAAEYTLSSPFVWTEAGPFNIGGRVTALAVAPGGSTIYLGAAAGGVFKSTNSGVNWVSIFDLVPSTGALALDPSNPSVVYVGTGEGNAAIDNYDGSGVYGSSDGGQSWAYLGLQETRRIARLAVDPQSPNRIFVAAMGSQYSTNPHRGLYRTLDGGQSWAKVLFVNDSTGVCDVVVNPAHPETVFCATWERIRRPTYRRTYGPGCGIWRSVDHGATWTRILNGLPGPSDNVGRIGLAIAPSRPSTIYAQIIGGAPGHNGLGIFRSTDGGTTWVQRSGIGFTSLFGGFGWYFGDMGVDPLNPDRIFCLGQNLGRSLDGGTNFTVVTGESHVDHHAIWIDPANPSRTYVGTDGGFYYSLSGGTSWTHSTDLPITQFYAGAIDPSNASKVLGGAQDNGTSATFGPPNAWFPLNIGGDGFYCVVDQTNPDIVFAEWQNGSQGRGPHRSTNGGSSFSMPLGFSAADRYNWNSPFVIDPNNHNVLLGASHRVYKSIDNGQNYSPVSQDLTRNQQVGTYPYSTITTLEIAKANSNYYYVGTDDGRVWRSKTAGVPNNSWVEITAGLPVRWVTRVSSDPTNAEVVYVTLSGYSQDEYAAHVYRSTNAGNTWTAIDGNLPDVPANDLLVDPLDPNRLYLANDVGVYTSADLGTTWYPLGIGLPINPVVDLTLHAPSRTLVAVTHGRSQWKLDLTQLVTAVEPVLPPATLSLSMPAPNPSRDRVSLTLELSSGGHAKVLVFDALGRRVTTLIERDLAAGRHQLSWDGRDHQGRPTSSGSYFVRATVDGRGAVSRRFVRL